MITGTSARKLNLLEGLADSISLSVSPHFHNKVNHAPENEQGSNAYAYAQFNPVSIDKYGLVELLRAGNAICVADLTTNWRNERNFKSSGLIGIDWDGLSVGEVLKNDFVRKYGFYTYATPSNLKVTDKNPDGLPRSRTLFCLDAPVHDATLYKSYVNAVLKHLDILNPDTVCTQAAQIFFGSTDPDNSFQADKILPVAVLEGLASNDAPAAAPVSQTPTNVIDLQNFSTWLETASRRFADTLGVTGYGKDGYSNLISCPCPLHKNNDANPSGAWNRDKYHLHCFTTKRNYKIQEVAAFLNIDLASVTAYRPGLHNSTREALMKAKHYTLCRFLEVAAMNNTPSGWYDLDGLRKACEGLPLSENSLRYMGLFDSGVWSTLVDNDKMQRAEGLFFAVFRINCISDISFVSAENGAKNSIRIPKPPEPPSGRGRPKKFYYIPSEQDFAHLLNIELKGRDWLSLADVQTEKRYCETYNKRLIQRAAGQYDNTWLGNRVGRTSRTIRAYISNDDEIERIPQTRTLGIVDNVMLIPSENDDTPSAKNLRGKRFLEVTHDKTGELVRYGYTRENASKLLRWHTVRVCTHAANFYRVVSSNVQPETMPQTAANQQEGQLTEPATAPKQHQNSTEITPSMAAELVSVEYDENTYARWKAQIMDIPT